MNWETLLIGLVGAVLGAGGSLGAMLIQTRAQARRDRARLASEMALEEFRIHLQEAVRQKRPPRVPPLATYVHFHAELVKMVERGALTAENLSRLNAHQKGIERVYTKPDVDDEEVHF